MNARGDIAGEWDPDPNLLGHGFLLPKNGSPITFDAPGAPPNSSLAIGITDYGQILGVYQDAGGVYHGFVVPAGSFAPEDFTFFELPGIYGFPETMNDAGMFVGYFADANGTHGFIASPTARK